LSNRIQKLQQFTHFIREWCPPCSFHLASALVGSPSLLVSRLVAKSKFSFGYRQYSFFRLPFLSLTSRKTLRSYSSFPEESGTFEFTSLFHDFQQFSKAFARFFGGFLFFPCSRPCSVLVTFGVKPPADSAALMQIGVISFLLRVFLSLSSHPPARNASCEYRDALLRQSVKLTILLM